MNFKKTLLQTAIAGVIGVTSLSVQAAALNAGDTLTINTGVGVYDSSSNLTNVTSGSFFGMDISGNSNISGAEKTIIGQGPVGIEVGVQNTLADIAGSYDASTGAAGPGYMTDSWFFNNAWGTNWAANAGGITGDTTTGLDFSGWNVAWNTDPYLEMITGAWTVGNCATLGCIDGGADTFASGIANFSWDGVYGNAYQIDYTATVQTGGFAGTQYFLRLEGVVNAAPVPVPAAVWLFGSGLLGLVGVARRKKSA